MPLSTPLRDYQLQAVEECARRPGSLLDMQMGTGKTLTALALLDRWEVHRALVLCPLSVVRVWPREARERADLPWDFVPLDVGSVAQKAEDASMALSRGLHTGRPVVLVVNYESAWREPFRGFASRIAWSAAVCDESHRVKAPGGKQSLFAKALGKMAARRLALSGTPLPHSPLDAYAQYRFLDPRVFGTSFNRFKRRYAVMGGFEGYQVIDWQNMDEFRRKFGSIAYQLHTKEVLDLPPEVDVVRTCRLEPKAARAYESLDRHFWAEVEAGEITARNALSKLLRLQQVTSGDLPTDEGGAEEISMAKTELMGELLFDVAPPVVVFCRFQRDLDRAHAAAQARGWKSAELSGRAKDALDADGRLAPGVDLAAVQIQAGGVGVDLSRASTALYYSMGFSLGDYLQSRSRLHRPGQQGACVTFIHLVCEGTVDRKVVGALRKRQQVIESILDKRED